MWQQCNLMEENVILHTSITGNEFNCGMLVCQISIRCGCYFSLCNLSTLSLWHWDFLGEMLPAMCKKSALKISKKYTMWKRRLQFHMPLDKQGFLTSSCWNFSLGYISNFGVCKIFLFCSNLSNISNALQFPIRLGNFFLISFLNSSAF